MERRLAAILAADVVGYTRLMGADEEGTLAALRALRAELIDPRIAGHNGRLVKLMGDGALVEFASVVDALRCAAEIQRAMAAHNADIPEDRRIVLRIGINLGDIIVEGEDIYGDGVNVAARLEGLAEPGGICISRSVFDQVKGKVDLGFEYQGEQEVKNIADPVPVYRVLPDGEAAGEAPAAPAKPRGTWRRLAMAAAVVLVAVASILAWQRPWEPRVEPANIENMAFPLPEKPSIAVLSFDNLSGDPEQDYFADGMTEDIITGLSRFPDLFVVARNSTFSYKGRQVPVKQVAEELGVRYVLEGSVQKAGSTVRVTAQLIDATTGRHLWAENYDRKLADVFAVRDEVTRTIIATMMGDTGELTRAEIERASRKDTESLAAYELVLRGLDIWLRFTPEANAEAASLFEKAIALDPAYARAYAVLAWVRLNEFRWNWSDSPERSIELALDLARKSVELDAADDWSQWALGVVYLYMRQHDEAMVAYERAIELNPNYADLLAHSGFLMVYVGRPEEAIARVTTAMRLNPYYPPWYLSTLGLVVRIFRLVPGVTA